MSANNTKTLTKEEEKHNRDEAAKLFYRTLSVNHPHVTLEKCYQLYDQIIEDKKRSN